MDSKFAILKYASEYADFIPNKTMLAIGNKKLLHLYARKKLTYKATDFSVIGADGFKVILPLTAEDAESDKSHKNAVYEGVLAALRHKGVAAVKPIRESAYTYDDIITAASGFYILPFALPNYIGKCAKACSKDRGALEILIIDGMADLTIDILCVISSEINRITVFTDRLDFFNDIAHRFYSDSGLNINVTDKRTDPCIGTADVILNASAETDSFASLYKKGAFFLDMAGNGKKVSDLTSRRADVVCADGIEFKRDGKYIDNILLEAVCLSNSERFANYVLGHYTDDDFYGFLDYIESLDLQITTFLRFGKNVRTQ